MSATDRESYAEVLHWALNRSRARPLGNGDIVLVRYDIEAVPLAEAVYARLMDAHLHPFCQALPTPWMEAELLLNSSYGQLMATPPGEEEMARAAAGVITILAPEKLDHLARIDPRVMAERGKAVNAARRIMERRRRLGELGWTVCIHPTQALADASGMELSDYAEALTRACWLNMPSPVAEWRRLARRADEITAWLDGLEASAFHVEGEGVDLVVEIGGDRRFLGVTGSNIPGYEIFTAPDSRAVNGYFTANQPSIHRGHLVQGARLEFHDGVLTDVRADHGEQYLQIMAYMDFGARRVGEFSMTDKAMSRVDRFLGHTLLDENHGGEHGNCHIALGASPLEAFTGAQELLTPEMRHALGFNDSSIHWDLVHTAPRRVTARLPGGRRRVVYENGGFML